MNTNSHRVVVANGCFDCLHAGHISLLQFAKAQGDRLIVLLNSDESVKRLKGPTRPVWCVEERVRLLMSLRPVDNVVIFDEDTPDALLSVIRPDVLVKGADNEGKPIPGSQFCGRVAFAPFVPGISTTKIIEAMKAEADAYYEARGQ